VCSIFDLLTKLHAEENSGDANEVIELERQIIYRSDFLHRLSEYIESQYRYYKGGDFNLAL